MKNQGNISGIEEKSTNLASLHKQFLELESKHDLFQKYHIDSTPLWALIRFPIWSTLILFHKLELSLINTGWSEMRQKSLVDRVRLAVSLMKGTLTQNPFFGLIKSDLLFLNSMKRVKYLDFNFDIYTDYLINFLSEYQSLSLIRTAGQNVKPLPIKNYKYLDVVHLYTFKKKFFGKNNDKIKEDIRNILTTIIEEFNFEVKLEEEVERLFLDKVINFREYKKAFKKILLKVKPKIVLEVSHYGAINMALSTVAHEYKIPCVELQHGVIDKYHIGYQYKHIFADQKTPFSPSHVFLFGDYWKNHCNLPMPEENKIVTGFPHFEIKRKEVSQISKHQTQILIISQWTLQKDLIRITRELAVKLGETYELIYKLHPAEYQRWRDDYTELIPLPNVRIVGPGKEKSLYELFAESNYQIGVYSTAIYEGLAFRLKTFILDLPGREYMADLVENGFVSLVKNADEIIEQLNRPVTRSMEVSSKIWENNALEKMKVAIDSIVRNGF